MGLGLRKRIWAREIFFLGGGGGLGKFPLNLASKHVVCIRTCPVSHIITTVIPFLDLLAKVP